MPDANTAPIFTRGPLRKGFYISQANTNRDGNGNIVEVVRPEENGCRVDCIGFKAVVTTTAGTIRIYLSTVGAPYPWVPIGEVLVAATTASGTAASWEGSWTPPNQYMTLRPGQSIGVGTNNAEAVIASPEGGHF